MSRFNFRVCCFFYLLEKKDWIVLQFLRYLPTDTWDDLYQQQLNSWTNRKHCTLLHDDIYVLHDWLVNCIYYCHIIIFYYFFSSFLLLHVVYIFECVTSCCKSNCSSGSIKILIKNFNQNQMSAILKVNTCVKKSPTYFQHPRVAETGQDRVLLPRAWLWPFDVTCSELCQFLVERRCSTPYWQKMALFVTLLTAIFFLLLAFQLLYIYLYCAPKQYQAY